MSAVGPTGTGLEILEEVRSDERLEQRLRVPPGLPCLEGHFPGLPVLPGLAQLEWAVGASAVLCGRPVRVRRIEALKFRELVQPEESLVAILERGPDPDRLEFQILREDRVASSGRLRVGGDVERGGGSSSPSGSDESSDAGQDARELIPHAGPMVFVDRLLEGDEKHTICSVRIETLSLFRDADGALPAWAGLEPMAQSIAAHGGLEARRRGHEPKIGFLLGCRRLEVQVDRLKPGVGYAASATQIWGADQGLVSFDCELFERNGGARMLAGRINAYLPSDLSAVLEGQLGDE